MSVINKMLRDLDSRQAFATNPVPTRQAPTGMARGTLSVNDADLSGRQPGSPRAGVLLSALVVLLAAAGGAWWYQKTSGLAPLRVAAAPGAGPAMAAVTPPAVPVAPAVVVEAVPMASPTPAADLAAAVTVGRADAVATPALASQPVAPSDAAQGNRVPQIDSSVKSAPRADTPSRSDATGAAATVPGRRPDKLPSNALAATQQPVISAPAVPATVAPVVQSVPRQAPALQALAQAQSLWNAGSQEAAMGLAREALTLAEQSVVGGAPAGNHSVLASVARELARMELAQGRAGQALEMLTRLEPALSGFADVWALRGNAAQRQGRHQESAAAYLTALRLRPDEPRWLLGAAVSLAAQGQTASAAELAEKARAGGVLSLEVESYLRQLGVPLRQR